MKFFYFLMPIMLFVLPLHAQAETAYQRFMRIAEQARQQGDFNTALINYGRAHREKPRNLALNSALSELLEERLQNLAKSNSKYVKNVRLADRAYYEGDYDIAIINYTKALEEKPSDYYASTRIQQAKCIQAEQPATHAQFTVMCPSLYPQEN